MINAYTIWGAGVILGVLAAAVGFIGCVVCFGNFDSSMLFSYIGIGGSFIAFVSAMYRKDVA